MWFLSSYDLSRVDASPVQTSGWRNCEVKQIENVLRPLHLERIDF
jgi:hypothetical protein